jgi:hypothetical protein
MSMGDKIKIRQAKDGKWKVIFQGLLLVRRNTKIEAEKYAKDWLVKQEKLMKVLKEYSKEV